MKINPESIPDDDEVYRRVHPTKQFDNKKRKPRPSVFILRPEDKGRLSVNWSKYTTPDKAVISPNSNVSFILVGLLAIIPRQNQMDVIHTPSDNDPSHSNIIGTILVESNEEMAEILADNARVIIDRN